MAEVEEKKVAEQEEKLPEGPKTSPKVPIEDTTPVTCTRCNSELFAEKTILRMVPADKSKTGKEETVPVKVLCCDVCSQPR